MGAEVDDPRVSNCGLWGWRPSFLKVFNKPMIFMVMFSLSTFSVTITLGMNQVLLPALQQLFNMTSKQMGMILISNDLSGLLVAFIFGHFSSKGKMRWMFFGIILLLIANVLQAGTQLFVMLPDVDNVATNGTTKNDVLCSSDAADILIPGTLSVVDKMFYAVQNNKLFWILFVAGVLQGIGGTPQQVCGMTYLDEVMTEKKLGPALAYSNVIQYMGFSLSFVLGAFLMTQYVTLGTPPEGVSPGSSYWVGAWWMGYLAPGVLLALTGLPLVLFPTQMPAAKVVLQEKIERGEATEQEKDSELNRSYLALLKDMVPTLKRLMRNKALWFLLIGESLSNIFLSSMPYDTKLLSLLLKMSIPETGTMLGILRSAGTVIGLAIGGAIMGKYNLSGKKCVLYVAIAQLITLPSSFLPLLHCNTDNVAGISLPYPVPTPTEQWTVRNLTNECNEICGCSAGFYDPLCDLESKITYFSPCHAGCTSSITNETNKEKIFQNCMCSGADLVPGACPAESSCAMKKWIVFIGQSLIGVIIYISCYPALHIAYLRVVPELDRSATQGMKQCITRAFGFMLGPIIFGAIIDSYCLVWRGEGSSSGSCWLYDLHNMIVTFTMGQLGFRATAVICFFICWKLYPEKAAYSKLDTSEKNDLELKVALSEPESNK